MAKRSKSRPYRPKGESREHYEARLAIGPIHAGETPEQFEARIQSKLAGGTGAWVNPNARAPRKPPEPRPPKPPATFLGPINAPYEYRKRIERGEYTEKQVRAEYMRLRRILAGRLKTFAAQEPGADFAQRNPLSRYPPQSKLTKQADLLGALAYLRSQLNSAESTVSGYRAERRKQAQWLSLNYGIDLQTREDWDRFSEFMNYARSVQQDNMRYSIGLLYIIGREGIQKIYEEWKANRFDPLNPPQRYLDMVGDDSSGRR